MSIEFIGLPGAGKSSICHDLSTCLSGSDSPLGRITFFAPVDSSPRIRVITTKLCRVIFFVLSHPVLSLKFAHLVRKSGQASFPDAFTKTLNLFAEMGREEWNAGNPSVSEQGVLQAIWSILFGAEHHETGAFVKLAAPFLPDCVIHIDADHGEILGRLEQRERGGSRLDRLPPEQRLQFLREKAPLFDEVVREWKHRAPRWGYRRIVNSGGVKTHEIAEKLVASLGSDFVTLEKEALSWKMD